MLANLIGPATQLLDKFIEDKDQKMALAHEISTMAERHAQELAKGQIEVNKMEAASSSMFVAGWRPAVGWICALGFASNFILIPMANFVLSLASIDVQIGMIDTTQMMPVLMGMLGLGTLRTVEKVRKVSREQ